MAGLRDILDVLYQFLPQEAVLGLLAVLALVAAPMWFRWLQRKQIKGVIRNLVSTTDAERRHALTQQLWSRIENNATQLTTASKLAREMGLASFAARIETRLRELGVAIDTPALRFEKSDQPGRLHPLEIATRVDALLEQGLIRAAQQLVDEGLSRLPHDDDLQDAQQRINAYRSESATISTHSPQEHHERE